MKLKHSVIYYSKENVLNKDTFTLAIENQFPTLSKRHFLNETN